ncbi:uncharacterized protein BJ212DRAFT_1301306 [Suillus subaureus]|uniref:Uncharacterized protein n=1 Tax=Suillus subaureus TaxID=48587 RepID=A0A9P7E746_9AGAM|nr:uncharacterized protein BJ212DRAFT_1301306 [Suillus subaureus]KAG1812820.1 hypothetical protein BJ212DRAFT_1301306 [Suillus subaureus]
MSYSVTSFFPNEESMKTNSGRIQHPEHYTASHRIYITPQKFITDENIGTLSSGYSEHAVVLTNTRGGNEASISPPNYCQDSFSCRKDEFAGLSKIELGAGDLNLLRIRKWTNIAQGFAGDEIPSRDHNHSIPEDAGMLALHISDQRRPTTFKLKGTPLPLQRDDKRIQNIAYTYSWPGIIVLNPDHRPGAWDHSHGTQEHIITGVNISDREVRWSTAARDSDPLQDKYLWGMQI